MKTVGHLPKNTACEPDFYGTNNGPVHCVSGTEGGVEYAWLQGSAKNVLTYSHRSRGWGSPGLPVGFQGSDSKRKTGVFSGRCAPLVGVTEVETLVELLPITVFKATCLWMRVDCWISRVSGCPLLSRLLSVGTAREPLIDMVRGLGAFNNRGSPLRKNWCQKKNHLR